MASGVSQGEWEQDAGQHGEGGAPVESRWISEAVELGVKEKAAGAEANKMILLLAFSTSSYVRI